MASTLYDENRGGASGNTHLALGNSLEELYTGDVAGTTPEQFATLGFNPSSIHVDIISTSDRTVTATLKDGSTKVIYAGGQLTIRQPEWSAVWHRFVDELGLTRVFPPESDPELAMAALREDVAARNQAAPNGRGEKGGAVR